MTESTVAVVNEIDDNLDKKKYYIAPKDFRFEYYTSIDFDKPTNGLLEMFEKIARGWGRKYPKTNKQDLDSYIGFAVSEAWRKWKKYDPSKSDNLFAFFTSVIKNDMALAHNNLNRNKHLHVPIDGLFVNVSQL